MIHGISLPNLLNVTGYKPWQVHHLLDTMEMWKFGDYKHYVSLDLLCSILSIDSPKSELDGSQVSQLFWDGELIKIVDYCQSDVVATAQVYLKLTGAEIFGVDQVEYISG